MGYLFIALWEGIGVFCSIQYAKNVLYKIKSKKEIKKRTMIIIVCAHILLFLFLYKRWKRIDVFYYASLSSLLLSMAIIDQKEKVIPNIMLLLLFVFCIPLFLFLDIDIIDAGFGSLFGCIPLWIVTILKKDSIGEGDLYFLAGLGFISGTLGIHIIVSTAYLLAALYSVYLYIQKRANRKTEIAMIPFFYTGYLMFLLLYA